MNTSNSTTRDLLLCLGALLAADEDAPVKGQETPLVEATLRVLEARARLRVRVTPATRPVARRRTAIDPWVRG